MKRFLAKSDRQLGALLRVLIDEGYPGAMVSGTLNERDKVVFTIDVQMSDSEYAKMQKRFKIMVG